MMMESLMFENGQSGIGSGQSPRAISSVCPGSPGPPFGAKRASTCHKEKANG
jgi:hypothetical protein